MTFNDLAKSYCRVIVAAVVGWVIAFALRRGLDLSGYQGALTTVATGLYYAVVRLLERYVTPRFGWLLGLAQQPVYTKVTTRRDRPTLPVSSLTVGTLTVPVRTIVLPERPVNGKRLGRHVHHDERSRAYRVTPHPAPRSVFWTRHVKPYDQGNLGSCTGNAMAGALSTGPFKHRFGERTALTLYEAATRLDDVPGQYKPDDTGSSGLAVAKAARARGWITSYLHCFTLDDVISALQDGPCIAGTNWYSGMDNPDRGGFVHVTGTVRGGHEYELVGVDLAAKLIHAVNSWGTGWGDQGHFSIGFDDFRRLLAEQGDVTVPRR